MKTKIRKKFLKEKHNQDGNISGKKDSQISAEKFWSKAGFWSEKEQEDGIQSEKGQAGWNVRRRRAPRLAAQLKRPRVIPTYRKCFIEILELCQNKNK